MLRNLIRYYNRRHAIMAMQQGSFTNVSSQMDLRWRSVMVCCVNQSIAQEETTILKANRIYIALIIFLLTKKFITR